VAGQKVAEQKVAEQKVNDMTNQDNPGDAWRDFAHTVQVITASALARHHLDAAVGASMPATPASASAGFPPNRVVLKQFNITLLAASAATGFALPMTEFLVDGGTLGVLIDERTVKGEIRIVLQLKGYAAMQQSAGREAYVVSDNGSIDTIVQFSPRGAAFFVLDDLPGVRVGLRNFKLLTLGDDVGDSTP
jgi:hypothetical protein